MAGGVQFRFGRYRPRCSVIGGFVVVEVVEIDSLVDSSTSNEVVTLDFVDRIPLIASSADDVSDKTASKSLTFASAASSGVSFIDAEYTLIVAEYAL